MGRGFRRLGAGCLPRRPGGSGDRGSHPWRPIPTGRSSRLRPVACSRVEPRRDGARLGGGVRGGETVGPAVGSAPGRSRSDPAVREPDDRPGRHPHVAGLSPPPSPRRRAMRPGRDLRYLVAALHGDRNRGPCAGRRRRCLRHGRSRGRPTLGVGPWPRSSSPRSSGRAFATGVPSKPDWSIA